MSAREIADTRHERVFSGPTGGQFIANDLRVEYRCDRAVYAVRTSVRKALIPLSGAARIHVAIVTCALLGITGALAISGGHNLAGWATALALLGFGMIVASRERRRKQPIWNLGVAARIADVMLRIQILADTTDGPVDELMGEAWYQVDLVANRRDTSVSALEAQVFARENPHLPMGPSSAPLASSTTWSQPPFTRSEPSNQELGIAGCVG